MAGNSQTQKAELPTSTENACIVMIINKEVP
jgi:hypothetical protein